MKNLFKILCCGTFIFIICGLAFAGFRGAFPGDETPPAPELISPASENLNLAGKTEVEFRWIASNFIMFSGYEFKLYKGYETILDNLMHTEKASNTQSSIKLPISMFTAGQVYTWRLRNIATGGQRSDWSGSTFKILKMD